MSSFRRRDLLKAVALALLSEELAQAAVIQGHLPWHPDAGDPPQAVKPGGWIFFTAAEAATVEALADRIIPPDPETPGGKEAGCAIFIDRQLAGSYGTSAGLYDLPPFTKGTKQQGPQSATTPAQVYRQALAALERYCNTQEHHSFASLSQDRQDALLHSLEAGSVRLEGTDAQAFFATLVKDMQQGFFADPIYGGNRDMCAWKMIGFPGARYDYRDWVTRHNEPYPLPPVSIGGSIDWTPKRG